MNKKLIIQTPRLILRQWQEEDLEPFAVLNADPRVMECFPSTLSKQESDALVKRILAKIEENGWGMWAASLHDKTFIGFIGLNAIDISVHFAPAVEIGWRLAHPFWGKGYATEGALACLQYGFKTLHLEEIVSLTATQNHRSQAVMKRIGMHRNIEDDFDHPKLPEGHKLRRHVLYRLSAEEWQRLQANK